VAKDKNNYDTTINSNIVTKIKKNKSGRSIIEINKNKYEKSEFEEEIGIQMINRNHIQFL
jgi:hypothetical protein